MAKAFKITKKPMKVLHISTEPSWRGGEQQLAYLYSELEEFEVQQVILCAQGSAMEKHCHENGWNYFTAKKSSGLAILFSNRIKSLCKKLEIDLIHTHDSHAHTFAIVAATVFGNSTPVVVSRRVDFPIKKKASSLFKYNHKVVKKIVCVSEKIKEITAADITDSTKLITVHSGIDTSRFDGAHVPEKLKNEIRVRTGFLIGNTSALADHKDYFTFLDSVVAINELRSDCHFVIIGSGPLENEIHDYARQLKLSNVTFTGFRNDLPEILGDLDLFLITSKTEGLGTSILDAFACEIPVIATAAGGIPEIVKDEYSGLIAPVKDPKAIASQVNRLLNDKNLAVKLIKGAKEVLKQHTKSTTAKNTMVVYESILEV